MHKWMVHGSLREDEELASGKGQRTAIIWKVYETWFWHRYVEQVRQVKFEGLR